ncbi:MAG TPA: pre-16S rRNA-processing nuclease YqgF, partial [Gammaproteobacteria bacterium]|nr:pre-16S rRNA-processing nuclease YqgF [Gammaproteobacteria bacterium]
KPIRAFAAQLQKRYDMPVEFVNEAFTSFEAQDRLKQQRQRGRKKRVKKIEIDQQAAAVIVETWLELHRAT